MHVGEPILALLRTGDHGDDLADAIAHVARCVDCRARLTAGEIGSRAVVVVAIEAPRNSQGQLERAAEVSKARLVERGHGRWTAVVDADRADKLKSELVKGEQSVVTRLVVSTPLDVPREELASSRRPMPSMFELVPKERGTEAAEMQAWVQMRRQPKRKVSGASPGWALFAVAAVGVRDRHRVLSRHSMNEPVSPASAPACETLRPAMLSLRLLERVREVPREAWDALAVPSASPFAEWTWLDCLEEARCVGADAGWHPRHFALYRGNDLIAAAPAYIKGNSEGEFVFDWAWADVAARMGIDYYPKLVIASPFTPATGDRALIAPGENAGEVVRAFVEGARALCSKGGISSAHVLFPREAEAGAWERAGLVARVGVQYHWENDGYAKVDDFLARFNAKKRHQIRRETAQPEKSGITIETLSPGALDEATARAMYRFYIATVDKFHWGRRYLTPAFFPLVASRFAHRLAWVVARKDGEPVAGAFNVKKDDRLYGRYWGSSPAVAEEPFLHFNVCYYHGVADCIAQGLRVFEPGAGGEHKKARGFLPTITHSAHWIAEPRLRRLIAAHLEREREAVQAHLAEERAASGMKARAQDADDASRVAGGA